MVDSNTQFEQDNRGVDRAFFTRTLVQFVIALAIACAAALWVSRIPETREELIADVNFAADVLEYQNAGIDEIREKTATLATNVNSLVAKVSTSALDDKTKRDISGDLQALADQLASLSGETGDLAVPSKQTSLDPLRFSLSIVSKADAAPKAKPVRPKREPTTWIERPGNKLWLAIIAGVAFALPFFALLASTKDNRKIAICDKMLSMVLSFFLGLAGGTALPNL